MVIAIDGPGGVGKSTVARAVAAALSTPYLDTGGFYRAVALAALRSGVGPDDQKGMTKVAAGAALDFDRGRMLLNGEDISADIRRPEVTAVVSQASAIAEVRLIVVEQQREWVRRHGGDAVVEGRDIGSVVFPDAAVKVFLTADPMERARRRAGDQEASGQTMEEVARRLADRDHHDSTREVSPLRPAPDAVVIDTSRLEARQVVAMILDLLQAQAQGAPPGGG